MKIYYLVTVFLVLLAVAMLSGCVGESIAGTYTLNSSQNVTLNVYEDGTFTISHSVDNYEASGEYRKEGDVYVFATPFQSLTFKTNDAGNLIVPKTGGEFIKIR